MVRGGLKKCGARHTATRFNKNRSTWTGIVVKIRLVKIDELQFLTCFKHGLWGSKSARFKEWDKGDGLVFIVGKTLTALAEVVGSPFSSKDIIWDNGLFPYRVPIAFHHVLDKDDRVPILGKVRQAMTDSWGPRYGWGILNQQALSGKEADIIIDELQAKSNALAKFQSELEQRIDQAKLEREAAATSSRIKKQLYTETHPREEEGISEDLSLHTILQRWLIELGRMTGCLVWIAASDRARTISDIEQEGYLTELPRMGLSEEATRRISYIDVIWVRQNAPVCAFEIETTTSIYSGLLRMSDLLAVVPALKLDLFVVAPRERRDKVMGELSRPTFLKLGLSEYCRFIAAEDLRDLSERVRGLSGHLQPSILDTIAVALEE